MELAIPLFRKGSAAGCPAALELVLKVVSRL
jgi:hypothetical protein